MVILELLAEALALLEVPTSTELLPPLPDEDDSARRRPDPEVLADAEAEADADDLPEVVADAIVEAVSFATNTHWVFR